MSNQDKSKQLEEQIDLRIELLEKAIDNEVVDLSIPKKLTPLRLWEDAELGIKRIGSPSSFVTTHKVYGRKIRKIKKLLGDLNKPNKPKPKSLTKRHEDAIKENARLKRQLQTTTNQFVQYSSEIKKHKDAIVLSKSIETGLREQVEELEAELTEVNAELTKLRKRLLKYESGTKSKVTKVDFRKGD